MLSKCPKCDHSQSRDNTSCESCGIVFEKYYKYHSKQTNQIRYQQDQDTETQDLTFEEDSLYFQLKHLVLPEPSERPFFIGRVLLLLFFMVWGVRLMSTSIASNAVGESFLHMINLPFHEAGHVIFSPFGSFIQSLGGTLGQILMPTICTVVLLIKHNDAFGASITFWWVAENFLDIAPYINDARAGVLPLIGGNFGHSAPYGFHDWEYLLTETGLINYDHQIASFSFFTGSVLMILSYVWTATLLYREYQLKNQ